MKKYKNIKIYTAICFNNEQIREDKTIMNNTNTIPTGAEGKEWYNILLSMYN